MTTQLLDDLKNIFIFDKLENVDKNKLGILIRWLGFEPLNLGGCLKLNKYFFYLNKTTLLYALHFSINKQKRFIQYIKKSKDEGKLDFLKQTIQEYYDWSDSELKTNWHIVELMMKDKEYRIKLDKMFGFSQAECKLLDIPYNKPKVEKLKKETTKSLDGWF